MRAPALLVLLLAPLAVAQVPEVPLVELTAEDLPMVKPLQGAVSANLTTRFSCALITENGSVPVTYKVENAPPWAQAVVSPASDAVDVRDCQGGYATRTATLSVTASDQAAGFRPTTVQVSATVGAPGREEKATAASNLTADYFSIIDTQLVEATKLARPGERVVFPLKVSNLGNARTRVHVEVENRSEGVTVAPIAPVVLESKQQGGSAISANVDLVLHTRDDGGLVNRVDVVTFRVRSEHAEAPERAGDATAVSVVLTTKSGITGRAEVPGAPLVLLALGALAAAVASRRPR